MLIILATLLLIQLFPKYVPVINNSRWWAVRKWWKSQANCRKLQTLALSPGVTRQPHVKGSAKLCSSFSLAQCFPYWGDRWLFFKWHTSSEGAPGDAAPLEGWFASEQKPSNLGPRWNSAPSVLGIVTSVRSFLHAESSPQVFEGISGFELKPVLSVLLALSGLGSWYCFVFVKSSKLLHDNHSATTKGIRGIGAVRLGY